MVDKITSFKMGEGKKGNFKNGKPVATPVKKPKAEPKPETQCFYCKGMVTKSGNTQNTWQIKKVGDVNQGIFDIHVIDV